MKHFIFAGLSVLGLLFTPLSGAGSYDDFFLAIDKDNPELVQSLLNRGFDPNTISPKGIPALLQAIKTPAPKVTRLLLAHPDIKIEARTPQDESALMLAAFNGDVDLCRLLVEQEADVNKPGWTPLHYAATNSHLAVIRLLLDSHAYIDAESPNRTTPLMMAAMYGNSSAVKLLLESGADPSIKNDKGLGALEFAQQVKKFESAAIISAFIRALRPQGTW